FAGMDVARGFGAGLYVATGAAAVLHLARQATGAGFGFVEQRLLLAQAVRWEVVVLALALGFLLFAAAELARGRRTAAVLLPLAAALASCGLEGDLDPVALASGGSAALLALAVFGRPASRPAAWSGLLLLGLVVGIALQVAAPLT